LLDDLIALGEKMKNSLIKCRIRLLEINRVGGEGEWYFANPFLDSVSGCLIDKNIFDVLFIREVAVIIACKIRKKL